MNVLHALEQHTLTPEAIEEVITLTQRDDVREQYDALESERKDANRRIDWLHIRSTYSL